MFIVLIKDNKVREALESEHIEINGNNIRHDNGRMSGVKGDIYVLDHCDYEVGQELTDTEITSLDNKSDNYIVRTVEQELARKDEQIKSMQRMMNDILFGGGL